VCTTPEIVVLRRCGWWWQSGVQNMTRIRNSFVKQLVICGVTQFFKSWQVWDTVAVPSLSESGLEADTVCHAITELRII